MPRLTHIVNVNKSGMVTSFASGKTEKNFYDAICNGKYELESSESKSQLEKRSQGGTVNDPTTRRSSRSDAMEDDNNDDDGARSQDVIRPPVEDIACIDGNSAASGVEGVASAENPFGVKAPPHDMFYSMLSFVCFGPLTTNFSATLAFGTPLTQTVAERKKNLRAAQCLKEMERRDAERSAGHAREMNMLNSD